MNILQSLSSLRFPKHLHLDFSKENRKNLAILSITLVVLVGVVVATVVITSRPAGDRFRAGDISPEQLLDPDQIPDVVVVPKPEKKEGVVTNLVAGNSACTALKIILADYVTEELVLNVEAIDSGAMRRIARQINSNDQVIEEDIRIPYGEVLKIGYSTTPNIAGFIIELAKTQEACTKYDYWK